jgi:type II secretory pathway component PulF
MKQYIYKISDKNGFFHKGKLLANSEKEAKEKLTINTNNYLISIKQNSFYIPLKFEFSKPKIKPDEIIIFTRQLNMLFSAGMSIQQCLSIIRTLIKNISFKKILHDIYNNINIGQSFSQSLAIHNNIFGNDYIALVKAGEKSGSLGIILNDIYELRMWDKYLRKKIISALRYPVIVLSIAFCALIGMFRFVVPKFASMFAKLKGDLPAATKVIMKISNFITSYGLIILIAAILLVSAIVLAYKKTKAKYVIDHLFIKTPLFGTLYYKFLIARFCKIFSILYGQGMPIIEALSITKQISNNSVYQNDLDNIINSLKNGCSIREATQNTKLFNGIVSQMAAIGERSSNLDTMLSKLGELFSDDIEYILDNFFTYLEPVFIIIIGLIILALSLGIFLPMLKMTTALTM